MKLYNDEIKVLNDLKYRYAHIHCHGSYGVNPAVIMLTRESTMRNAFIKDFEFDHTNDGEISERYLIVDSEYDKEVKVPMSKIIGMDILSSEEQTNLETYLRHKERWEDEIVRFNEMLNEGLNDESLGVIKDMVGYTQQALKRGEELVQKGVKTYK